MNEFILAVVLISNYGKGVSMETFANKRSCEYAKSLLVSSVRHNITAFCIPKEKRDGS